jgi:diguanylate cyclase (GGDEF)-like protein
VLVSGGKGDALKSSDALFRALWQSAATRAPMIIVVLVVIACSFAFDYQNRQRLMQDERSDVLSKLSLIRAKLEGNINGNLQLVRGLVATIATEPDMDQERFASLAKNLFNADTHLRNIAGAPSLVVRLMYPMAGNEKAIGLDYMAEPRQRMAALRARDRRHMVLAGPIDLRQGGQGFIGRYPVFLDGPRGGQFWGLVSAVVDIQQLYRSSGVLDPDLDIEIAMRGRDGLGAEGAHFFGPAAVMESDPVTADVAFSSGTWRMMAIPKGGWASGGQDVWALRAIMAIIATGLIIPVWIAERLARERQRNYGELRLLSERLKLALDASSVGVWDYDLTTNEVQWDARLHEIYGTSDSGRPYLNEDWIKAIHPDDRERAQADVVEAMKHGGIYSSEYRIQRPTGDIRFVRSRAIIYSNDGNKRMIGAEWDVTADVEMRREIEQARQLAETRYRELESAKSSIEHNALHDSLTGLPNRRFLDQVLQRTPATSKVAILHIDLDRFKHINDTLGHAAGDAMLVRAAQILRATVRPSDFVARIGGDEFVILCAQFDDLDSLTTTAEQIIGTMREPVPYQGHMCRFGVSIGIAVSMEADTDAKQLLVNADLALYRAKRRGRDRLEFFDQALQLEILHTKILADDILGGLERNEFVTLYQPQFDSMTLKVVGAEALVRWRHPMRGTLSPGSFIKIAEELNVMPAIDGLVLEQAKADIDRWRAEGLELDHISVNVSARRLEDPQLIRSLSELKLEPGTISFELVESIFLDDGDDARAWNVNDIKALGIDIEIDDFGTGHASIVSLLKLKPRRLKIDRQLIAPIVTSASQRGLVGSIIEIGKSLGVEVVAEGVETHQHVDVLRTLGCDVLQGFVLGRPMEAHQFRAFLQSRRAALKAG